MNRKNLLERAKGRAAGIILVLAVFALPSSAVLGARTGSPAGETSLPNGSPQIPAWEPTLDPNFSQSNNKPVAYNKESGEGVLNWYTECKTCQLESTNWKKWDPYDPEPKWPVSPTVKIETTWPSGQKHQCSGVLVDQTTVLTAAHCIYTHSTEFCDSESSCWPLNLQISAYQNTSALPSGFTELITWTAWTENRDYDYDLAGIKLDTPLGSDVGWLGFGYNNDNQFFSNKYFEHTSFVDDTLIYWNGVFTEVKDHIFYSNDASSEGQAGAGAHRNEYDHIVYSVLSHHLDEGEVKTGHTRITKEKFSSLRSWMNGTIKNLNFTTYFPYFAE